MSNPKIPPHDESAEESLLGAILINKDTIVDVSEFLRSEHFYHDKNGFIFQSMLALYDAHDPIDVVTVVSELKKMGKLKDAGGATRIHSLVTSVPTSAHAVKYAQIIKDFHSKRRLIAAAAHMTEKAFREGGDTKEILDEAEHEIFSIAQFASKQDFVIIRDALAASFDRLDELHKQEGGLRGVPTGFSQLDYKLAGMQKSNLIILAARPGTGKTAMVLNIAQHAAVKEKIPIGIFSLEMSKEELVDRLLVSQADIDAWKLKTGKLTDDDFTHLSDAMGELAEAPIFIDDTPGLSIMEMRSKARRLQLEHGVRLIIIDYLQLADSGRRYDNRVQEVSVISQSFKNLARELNVPVLACSQLSRAVESRGSKIPELSDLRESGSIEQDADVVMFLYREDTDQATWGDQIATKLRIAKHRNGPLAEIDLMFRGDRIKFYSVDRKREGSDSV